MNIATNVTATISTKDRYHTTLPLALEAIAQQTVQPKQLVIFDDGEMKDLRGISPYSHLFPMLMARGTMWYHLPGGRVGQVRNHQEALDRADTEYVWRLDDDNCPEPNCLENLLKDIQKDASVGAVGGLVLDPNAQGPRPSFITGKIEDIYNPFNVQWYRWGGEPEEVDHLYSTFLYRVDAARKAGGYCKELTPVGHREETMFSHSIKRAGYKLLVTPHALTWHLREGTGGIRSYTDGSLWARDEQVFRKKMNEWGVVPRQYEVIVLDNGIGDHIVFRSILPEIMKKHADKKIVLAVCYPEIFEKCEGVTLASIADAKAAFKNIDQWNIYVWCDKNKWTKSLADAFRAMYL